MVDTVLDAATARMAEVESLIAEQRNAIMDANARLARLEAERADVAAWIEMWHRLAGTQGRPVAAEQNEHMRAVDKSVKRKRPSNPDKSVVVDKALEIIRQHGEPMGRRALFDALVENGIVLEGSDPQMVLSTMLWRSKDRIVRLVPFGYWPAGTEYPPATELKCQLEAEADSLYPPPR